MSEVVAMSDRRTYMYGSAFRDDRVIFYEDGNVMNANMVMVGRTGSGKIALLKTLMLCEKASRSRPSWVGGNPPEGRNGLDGDE